MSAYAQILFFSLSLPLLLSFYRPLRFYRNPKALWLSLFWIFVLFGGWDVWAVYRGHWTFDPELVWSFRILNLPVEEVLFFPVISFCCIFSWEVAVYFRKKLKK